MSYVQPGVEGTYEKSSNFGGMIDFREFTLNNGLRVIVHEDPTVQIAVLNILYDVGSRDERPDKTGFAHLFEHLMFGGSVNIPNYDEPLQMVGGENNAFTNTDITNYYLTVPATNLETGFWLETTLPESAIWRRVAQAPTIDL
jgi:zinc protease